MIGQEELNRRIANMHRRGILKTADVPTVWQVQQAGWVMQPGITKIRPAKEPDYETWWSKMPQRLLLQGLTGSGSKDGTGFARDTDSQIWHILTIHHNNLAGFGYDLEMLAGHDDGLERMLSDVKAMISGTHPWHWLAWQIIGTHDYWPQVRAATEQFLAGNVSYEGSHVQPMVDLALSFPATPEQTFRHPEAMRRHLGVIGGMMENAKDLMDYVFRIRSIDQFPPPVPAITPAPLAVASH